MDKEYYIKQIQNLGKFITNKAEDILNDFDTTKILSLNLVSVITPDTIPTISVSKEYMPLDIEEN